MAICELARKPGIRWAVRQWNTAWWTGSKTLEPWRQCRSSPEWSSSGWRTLCQPPRVMVKQIKGIRTLNSYPYIYFQVAHRLTIEDMNDLVGWGLWISTPSSCPISQLIHFLCGRDNPSCPGSVCSLAKGVKSICLSPAITTMCSGLSSLG